MAEDWDSEPVRSLRARVKTDLLHSHAHLRGITNWLDPAQRWNSARDPSATPRRTFLYLYNLNTTSSPPQSFVAASDFKKSDLSGANSQDSRLLFLTGYPSQEWLGVLLANRIIDHDFAHRHLDYLSRGSRDYFTTPNLPSRSVPFIRLTIPSIIFIEPHMRQRTVRELHKARYDCLEMLRYRTRTASSSGGMPSGSSIVRDVHIHTGDTVVLEQNITIQVSQNNGDDLVRIWSDAGLDAKGDFLKLRGLSSFEDVAADMTFCPIFFENERTQKVTYEVEEGTNQYMQPLAMLSGRFGETLDWSAVVEDPVLLLQEIFTFQCTSMLQYLNMLRKHVNNLQAGIQPVADSTPKLDDIVNFEYTRGVLLQWLAKTRELSGHLNPGSHIAAILLKEKSPARQEMLQSYLQDLAYLEQEAQAIIDLCESGKSMILSNFSIMEAQRAGQEAKLVRQLTKATNRITFVFLPVSFVTSVFGMNFRQFGQGSLSIWIWVGVALPLVLFCILLVEWGGRLSALLR